MTANSSLSNVAYRGGARNVKWIEELLGRRQSLAAEAIIAVASAGFTKGAQKKAARYGVLLRDLRQLSDEEVTNWVNRATLLLYYYRYSDVTLEIGFASQGVPNLNRALVVQELQSKGVVQLAFNAAAQWLGSSKLLALGDTRTHRFGIRIQPENLMLCGEPALDIALRGEVCLASRPISRAKVVRYGPPTLPVDIREITVEQFTLGETTIVHHNARIATDIDLSDVELPPLSQVRYVHVSSEEELEHESFAVSNPEALRVRGSLRVKLYAIQDDSYPPSMVITEGMSHT